MSAHRKYDFEEIARLRAMDVPWDQIAEQVGAPSGSSLQSTFAHWAKKVGLPSTLPQELRRLAGTPGNYAGVVDGGESVILTEGQLSRITSLEDLITFFHIDTEAWEVSGFRVNKWEQASDKKGIVPLYQVRANLVRRVSPTVDAARVDIAAMLEEVAAARKGSGSYLLARPPGPPKLDGDPVLAVLNIYDPHLGLRAWGQETGGSNQDLPEGVRVYGEAVETLLSLARIYPVEEVLYVVGHDLFHVDQSGLNLVGGATEMGTPQDVDTRQEKLFTTVRRAVIRGIDMARTVAPVRVRCVQGNHDPQQVYRLGEVLMAWYRHDADVTIEYGPKRATFYGWGKNAWMLTHGENYKRHRDNLPLLFATECPPEIWSASTHREVLTGHWHKSMGGEYLPTSDLDEQRGIRVRSLPGLTAEDSWHARSGFKHTRAATLICYRKSGGVVGLHEYNP
jgi:hypothetical protein